MKIQLVNLSDKHPAKKFSNKSEQLNSKCLFQAKIKIESDFIREYKSNSISAFSLDHELVDREAVELDFIYKNAKDYGVGHNCSVTWSEDHKIVKTTFIPLQDIKDVINDYVKTDSRLDEVLDIKNLSIWGLSKPEIINNLKYFVDQYKEWITKQIQLNDKNEEEQKGIGKRIIDRQEKNYERLYNNIDLLNNERVFRAFQVANTTMFIQLVTSNDKDFGKEEKELNEINEELDFKSLQFFKEYNSEKRSQYRPFQLAFFLLSRGCISNRVNGNNLQ